MEQDEDMPPFWLQTTDGADRRRRQHLHRRHRLRRSYSSSLFSNYCSLVILLLVIALAFILIVIPTLISFISHIFQPQLVQKRWEYLNTILVLFAVVCGFLNRNTNENTNSLPQDDQPIKSSPSTSCPWFDQYSDRTAYNTNHRLRSSRSYPDLLQESSWITGDDERWKFHDDTHLRSFHVLDVDQQQQLHHDRPSLRQEIFEEKEDLGVKYITVETSVIRTDKTSRATPQKPPSSPPPKVVQRNEKPIQAIRQTEKDEASSSTPQRPQPSQLSPPPKVVGRTRKPTGQKEKGKNKEINDSEVKNFQPSPSTQPPPPPLQAVFQQIEEKSGGNERKRGIATKDIFTSLGKNKKRQKIIENLEAIQKSPVPPLTRSPPSRPPPPPSMFHNLPNRKKPKQKKIHPPKPQSVPVISTGMTSKTNSNVRPFTAQKPPRQPIKEKLNSENASPESRMPPSSPPLLSPPLPQFNIPAWKFRVEGDFIRVNSYNSSRSGSPDLKDGEGSSSSSKMGQSDGREGSSGSTTPLFCSSPDIDTKANNFIEKVNARLRLEKINSRRAKLNLGPLETEEEAGPS
ncbi:putative Hydroxyproline-rich glycoprotein family protein [Quillaja saponaria]|uniref:Hydroxyproline-rich glycoprotein family protein n=1 Tax=Quillaja saponaria TaxID=32244 RepID=A0AAD7LRY0_QUISA|nr:putative Hydroxyproline-rich glycoprotein family protein [Quillaja saponaria]